MKTTRPAAPAAHVIPSRLNHVACDGCNKPIQFQDGYRTDREFDFGGLPYILCSACCDEYRDADKTPLIIRRAGRFSKSWQRAVGAMLEHGNDPSDVYSEALRALNLARAWIDCVHRLHGTHCADLIETIDAVLAKAGAK